MTKKIFKVITNVFIGILITLTLYIAIFGSIARKNGDILTLFGFGYSYVPSNSMAGSYTNDDYEISSFKAGSLLFLKRSNFDNLKIGDVVVYYHEDIPNLRVHRIIDYDQSLHSFIAKGDNASNLDIVSNDNYRAVVTNYIYLGSPNNNIIYVQYVIISLFVLVLIIILIYQVIKIVKTNEEEKQTKFKNKHEKKLESLKQQLKDEIKNDLSNK